MIVVVRFLTITSEYQQHMQLILQLLLVYGLLVILLAVEVGIMAFKPKVKVDAIFIVALNVQTIFNFD